MLYVCHLIVIHRCIELRASPAFCLKLAMEEFKNKFVGKWVHDKSENVEEFFGQSGVTSGEVTLMKHSKPIITFSMDGNKCHIENIVNPGQTPEVKGTVVFEFDVKVNFEHPGYVFNVTIVMKDGKMLQNQITTEGGMVNHQVEYDVTGGDMKLTYTALSKAENNPISCVRNFKKQ